MSSTCTRRHCLAIRGALPARRCQATAQTGATSLPTSPFRRSVPDGVVTATPMALSLRDAIARGLSTNLAAIDRARADPHRRALSGSAA